MRSVYQPPGLVVAEDVWMLPGSRVNPNAYLLGDVLLDSVSRLSRRRLLRRLDGTRLAAHALTHVHPPTQGASRAVAEAFDISVWCGAGDAEALRSGDPRPWQPRHLINHLQKLVLGGPGVEPARTLREGDRVASFTVLETPGHSPGHLAFWRAEDRVLVVGDVVNAVNVWTGRRGLREPPDVFTHNPVQNRSSARRLAQLGAETVLFSHGPPLRNGERFAAFVAGLPD
ncbi:MAG: MBL fold metallo-hydrolase [Actinomycetota bacterium]|nr:MBL fold metallo-hydrolase [Actinomycetota bacterium]